MTRPIFHFPVSTTRFVSIDEGLPDRYDRFQIAFPVEELPDEIAAYVPDALGYATSSPLKLFTVSTLIKPLVYGQDHLSVDLLPIREFCKATGCPISKIISDNPCELAVVLYEKKDQHRRHDNHHPDRFGLGLEAIRIDPAKVVLPTWQNLVGG